jgi:hypothetical protein
MTRRVLQPIEPVEPKMEIPLTDMNHPWTKRWHGRLAREIIIGKMPMPLP